MQTVGTYLRRGIKIGIGTDTFPHNMIEEICNALYTSRLMARDPFDLRTSDIFDAATLGGAAALQRGDIGRLEKGAKADLVMVDVTNPPCAPCAIRSAAWCTRPPSAASVTSSSAAIRWSMTGRSRHWILRRPPQRLRRRSAASSRVYRTSTGQSAPTCKSRHSFTRAFRLVSLLAEIWCHDQWLMVQDEIKFANLAPADR
jgi:hypothetical protein